MVKNEKKKIAVSNTTIKSTEIMEGSLWNCAGAIRNIIIKAVTSDAIPEKKA